MENSTEKKNNSVENSVTQTHQNTNSKNEFKELLKFALVAIPIVLLIRTYVIGPFVVSGASMDSTFLNGQYLVVDELSYHFNAPKRGEVVIFKYPLDTKRFYIKRVIGLPGETVNIAGGTVTVTGPQYPRGHLLNEPYIDQINKKSDSSYVRLGDDEYFVMGDNRAGSSDSRIWGPVKKDLIVGRPLVRLFPFNKIDAFPGRYIE
jgi:signal peptidase I